MSAVFSMTVAQAIATDTYISDGIKQFFIFPDVLRQPMRKGFLITS